MGLCVAAIVVIGNPVLWSLWTTGGTKAEPRVMNSFCHHSSCVNATWRILVGTLLDRELYNTQFVRFTTLVTAPRTAEVFTTSLMFENSFVLGLFYLLRRQGSKKERMREDIHMWFTP